MKKYVLTVVDIGMSSNFVPHVLGIYNTKDKAQSEFKNDINGMINDANGMKVKYDYDKRYLTVNDGEYGAVWNIEEVEI